MDNDKRAGRTFFVLTVILLLAAAVKWLYFDPKIMMLSQNFQIDGGLLFASRMARLTILFCAFLLPPLAVKARFSPPRWVIWLLFVAGAGFDLWYILVYASGTGLIPQTDFLAKTWTLMYYTDKNMLYLVLPQLPIALAVAMGGLRNKAKLEEKSRTPDELTVPPPNTPNEEPHIRT